MENEQPFEINIGEDKFELTRHNSALILYLGNLAIHDHVRLQTPLGEGYIFCDSEGYEVVAEYMSEHEYPIAMNCPEVPEYVIDNHALSIKSSSDTSIEEELENWRRLFKNETEQ